MMRPYQIIFFFSALLYSCNGTAPAKNFSEIEGMYVNGSSGAYSKAFDTLVISTESNENIFMIERRTGYERIINGKPQPKQWRSENWVMNYDERKNEFTDTKKGKAISYVPEKKTIYLGNTPYLKINR